MAKHIKFGLLLVLACLFFSINYYKNKTDVSSINDTPAKQATIPNKVPGNPQKQAKAVAAEHTLTPTLIALHLVPSDVAPNISNAVLNTINLAGLQNKNVQLIDRTSTSDVLTEQVLQSGFSGRNFLGLVLADFTLSVEIIEVLTSTKVLFRLLRNDNAEIISLDSLEYSGSFAEDINVVLTKLSSASNKKKTAPSYRIALGQIFNEQKSNIGASKFLQHQVTQNLLSTKDQDVALVTRVSMLPLIFENYLRQLQQGKVPPQKSADLLINGHLINTGRRSSNAVTIFADNFKSERKLIWANLDSIDLDTIRDAAELISDGINSLYLPIIKTRQEQLVEAASVALVLSSASSLNISLNPENLARRKVNADSAITIDTEILPRNTAEARQNLSKSLTLDPSNLYAYLLLFQLQVAEGNHLQAEKTRTDLNWYFKDGIPSARQVSPILYNRQQPLKLSKLKERDIYPSLSVRAKRDNVSEPAALYYESISSKGSTQATLALIVSAELARHAQYKPNTIAIPKALQTRKHIRLPALIKLPYGAEANLHLGRAMQRSGLYSHLYGNKFAPLIEPKINSHLSNPGHNINTNSIVDLFASAYFLDPNKIEALFYLGYTLCTIGDQACKWGKLYHAWIAENIAPEQLFPLGGLTQKQVLRRNQINTVLFHSALSTGQLHTAKLSNSVKRNLHKQLADWLKEASPNQINSDNRLTVYCSTLAAAKASQREKEKMLKNILSLASTADSPPSQSEPSSAIKNKVIALCPTLAPLVFLMAATDAATIQQYNLKNIGLFYKNKLAVDWPGYFEELAINKALNTTLPNRYAHSIATNTTVNADNVLSIATLWYLSGNTNKAERLLRQFMPSFSLVIDKHSQLDGHYRFNGFDDKGLIRFTSDAESESLIYDASEAMEASHSLDERLSAWQIVLSRYKHLTFAKARKRAPNINISLTGNHRTFYHGYRDIHNPNDGQVPEGSLTEINVMPMDSNPPGLPRVLRANASWDVDNNLLLIGSPRAGLPVALKPYHFPQDLKSLETEYIIDRFFDLGYINSAGRLIKAPYKYSTMQFQRDFVGLSPMGATRIMKGLKKAWIGENVGKVFIKQLDPEANKIKSEVLGEGSIDKQFYGIAVSLHGNYALVCDGLDQIFVYELDKIWLLKQVLKNHPCSNISVSQQSAFIINGSESIYDLRFSNGYWKKGGEITLNDKAQLLKRGEYFMWFGNSLTSTNSVAAVANATNFQQGAVYVFEKSQSSWEQVQRISLEQFSIGQAVYLNNDTLWVTATTIRDKVQKKFVLVYHKIADSWVHTYSYKLESTVSSQWTSSPPTLAAGADGNMYVFSAQWFKLLVAN